MKQTARIISTYSADVFGVCSALYELGGMTIMHDPSGCNSTYTTHDEPRWFDQESMVYISGLSEMDAIMGNERKLIDDIVAAAKDLRPKFIAIAGTPIPTMTGFDFQAIASVIEEKTGIPAFGFPTTGMGSYISGANIALDAIVKRFAIRDILKTRKQSANILGLTPLDFSVHGENKSIAQFLGSAGFDVNACFAMGSNLDELSHAGAAHVNLVVSSAGLRAANTLRELFGTPYVVGIPIAGKYSQALKKALLTAVKTETNEICHEDGVSIGDIVVIGEGVRSVSVAEAIEQETNLGVKVICATECEAAILRKKDFFATDEDDIVPHLEGTRVIIADPLYRPVCPERTKFISLPHEAFSGRIYREQIPNLVADFNVIRNEVL